VRNPHLEALLAERNRNDEETWSSIVMNGGSVQHLDILNEHEKMVFKTAFELDQRWVIELAADRTPFICQSQSLNVFIPANVHKRDLHQIHFQAWKKGVKSLYYCRSMSIQRAEAAVGATSAELNTDVITSVEGSPRLPLAAGEQSNGANYEECLSCQ
jgi:ribonucleoside-diphosphate reductase alpha chain